MEVKLEGFKELKEALKKLPEEIRMKPLQTAVSQSAKVVQEKAKTLAPIKTGELRDNIVRYRARKYSNKDQVTYHVGMKKEWIAFADNNKNRRSKLVGKKYSRDKIYYWRFHEFGTFKMAAKPFLRPGFDSTKNEQLKVMQEILGQSIERIAKKLKK